MENLLTSWCRFRKKRRKVARLRSLAERTLDRETMATPDLARLAHPASEWVKGQTPFDEFSHFGDHHLTFQLGSGQQVNVIGGIISGVGFVRLPSFAPANAVVLLTCLWPLLEIVSSRFSS